MRTPRRRVAFRTPRKKSTPLKRTTTPVQAQPKKETVIEESDELEREAIEHYRKENIKLLNLQANGNLFAKLTGTSIHEEDGKYIIEKNINGNYGHRMIKFSLEEAPPMYHYRLIETNIKEMPPWLTQEIQFAEGDIHKFFYKVMEVMVSN